MISDISKVGFYCVNFKDENRRNKMMQRWETLGLPLKFVDPVETSDPRLQFPNLDLKKELRTWAIMLQHLDSIRDFVENTDQEYCIVCEDDIIVSKYLKVDVIDMITEYEKLNLDVMLLGYLLPFNIDGNSYFPELDKNYKFSFHEFPDDLWGSQMYLVSRRHAIILLDKYTIAHAIETIHTHPFSPDWTLTKFGKKAMVYPLIALEEGDTKCDLHSEISFHQRCFQINYNSRFFM
jgi:hypothetical protein